MRKERGKRRQFKTKGLTKINTIAPYFKNACKGHITSN